MSQTNASQAQHQEFFKKMMEEQVSRATSLVDELAKLEAQGVEQARAAVEEMGKLAKESIAYSTKLSAEWRKMSLDTFRKAADLWMPKA
jgi:acetyl-CoA acetyltransferase